MTTPESAHGYIDDGNYPTTYFRELSPAWLNYVAALGGAVPCGLEGPFTYLELGCGTANSTIIHALAFPLGEFHACDFNSSCIAAARDHAAASGVGNVHFHELAFADLLQRELPSFDFVVLHGVYSWVGESEQQTLRQLINQTLKPGGLAYISYNCLPGWSNEAPLRKLLTELAATATGDPPQRTEAAIRQLQRLNDSGMEYFRANPAAAMAVAAYADSPSGYLAHEFLNDSWHPRYAVDVADEMAAAGLSFIGSATLVDNHPELLLEAAAAEAVAGLETNRQQQLAVDFAVNRQFRRDVFVRHDPAAGGTGAAGRLGEVLIGCPNDPARISTTARVPRGEISFHQSFISKLQKLLADGPVVLGTLTRELGAGDHDSGEIARNLLYLIAAGELAPMPAPAQVAH